jgi:NitT/TauT family transport system permease protein
LEFEIKPWHKLMVVTIFFGGWELIIRFHWVDPFFIPPFSTIMITAWNLIRSGQLPYHALLSMERACTGFLAAVVIAVPLGILVATAIRNLRLVLEPIWEIGSQINPFILFHIILLFTGVGEATKITIVAWTCVWPLLLSTISGVLHIDPLLIKSAVAFGLDRRSLLLKVIMPAAAPVIYAGLRLSAGYAFFILIAVEMLGSSSGLGALIIYEREYFRTAAIFAAAGFIAVLGLGMDCLLEFAGKKLLAIPKDSADNEIYKRSGRSESQ